MRSPYMPIPARIEGIVDETPTIKTFAIRPVEPIVFEAGQFVQLTVPGVGEAPFTEEKHIFANLGDGTYFHSGILAIRQAVAAGANMTYKILFNDAVAMTGGQPMDGELTVADLVRQAVRRPV